MVGSRRKGAADSRRDRRSREPGAVRELTDQQGRFVVAFTSEHGAIGNVTEAARRAGYSDKSAHEIGRQLLAKPHIRAAIDDAHRQQIGGALAAKAVGVLDAILSDPEASMKLKLDAAKTVLDRAGHIAPKAADPDRPAEHKPLAEMTMVELQAHLAELRQKAALLDVRMIDVTPRNAED